MLTFRKYLRYYCLLLKYL